MSEAKFTKGPWRRDEYGHLKDADGKWVQFRGVSVSFSDNPKHLVEPEANTDLAAAAPELYEALEVCANALAICKGEKCGPVVQALAALARARGES